MSHPDPLRSVRLDNGYVASVCVTPDGQTVLWLLAHQGEIGYDDTFGCACRDCAPHEIPDCSIPGRMRAVLDRPTQSRCGRPRLDGHPCRTPVAHPGLVCHWHRTEETAR